MTEYHFQEGTEFFHKSAGANIFIASVAVFL